MCAREAFGPNLRRFRLQRGITLEQLSAATNVSTALWVGLEQNDLTRWPTGIYAREYVRQYARAIGVDPEATVDEFCRSFPHGDRRAEPTIRAHAEIVNHDLAWSDGVHEDRRGNAEPSADRRRPPAFSWLRGLVRTPR
jgi:transcriptional regulator with XRE-family HTH domain